MTCTDCIRAASEPWHGFTANCKGCDARALGRTFLARGERGRRFMRGCQQLDVTPEEVKAAHQADAMTKENTE
ncbi:MAG TPA: hypothetical protein VN201_13385 [Roseateles sp.]|nr:hypothetical protein [Roseateles sp.]